MKRKNNKSVFDIPALKNQMVQIKFDELNSANESVKQKVMDDAIFWGVGCWRTNANGEVDYVDITKAVVNYNLKNPLLASDCYPIVPKK